MFSKRNFLLIRAALETQIRQVTEQRNKANLNGQTIAFKFYAKEVDDFTETLDRVNKFIAAM